MTTQLLQLYMSKKYTKLSVHIFISCTCFDVQGSHGTLGDGSVPSVRPLLAIFGLRLVEAPEVDWIGMGGWL